MKIRILLCVLAVLAALALPAIAAAPGPVKWAARVEPADARAGEAARVIVTATIDPTFHIYSTTKVDGPVATTIDLVPGKALSAAGPVVQPPALKKRDEGFGVDVETYSGAVAFGLPVKLLAGVSGAQTAKVKIRYQACTDQNCLLPASLEVPVAFKVAPGAARPERGKPDTGVPPQPAGAQAGITGGRGAPGAAPPAASGFGEDLKQAQKGGLFSFLFFSLSMGFLALLTPCVFPMVPITVSFFSKQQEGSRRDGLAGALAYCLGIIATFTILGLLLTVVFGATGLQDFATNSWVNLALAVLFVVLALNLFGVFEIMLPQSLVNRASGGSRAGRFAGPVLMGLTFTLTSFTCTVPFVGTLLVTATQGDLLWPVVGMLAFSTAFASPFFLLALFPQWLARLPKSGGWLVTVKAYMGFLELAAAVKFVSNVDLVMQWGLLTRPVFLALWACIGVVAGFYLLGWLRLPHDPAVVAVGWPRRALAVLTVGAGLYCLAGINGAPLGEMTAFLPPDPYPGRGGPSSGGTLAQGQAKVNWIPSYDEGVKLAKEAGKPVFINFTGVTCTNCRWMEANMFTRPAIAGVLNSEFVPLELYTDIEGNPQSERNQKLQAEKFREVTLPLYAVITPDGEIIDSFGGLERDGNRVLDFLKKAQTTARERLASGVVTPEP